MSDLEGDIRRVIVDGPPPLLKKWGRVYVFVLCYVALLISALYGFTRAFAP